MGEAALRKLTGNKTLTISWITPYLAVGDEVDASLRSELLKAGITITVDVRKCFDNAMNPIYDEIYALRCILPVEKYVDQYKILIHCQGGIDRSPFFAACYLWGISKTGESLMDCYERVKKARPQTMIHDEWVRMFE
jgi:hypothetical protein